MHSSLKSFGRAGGQDPHLSLMGKLKIQEKTGLHCCVATPQAWSDIQPDVSLASQLQAKPLKTRPGSPNPGFSQLVPSPKSLPCEHGIWHRNFETAGTIIGVCSLETWPHLYGPST